MYTACIIMYTVCIIMYTVCMVLNKLLLSVSDFSDQSDVINNYSVEI